MDANDIAQKRSVLLAARIRFSPQIQPAKEAAIDKIVEQILFMTPDEKGSPEEIQKAFSSVSGGYVINPTDMRSSLGRLVEHKRIVPRGGKADLYELSGEAKDEIENLLRQAESLFNSVVERLFKNATQKPSGSCQLPS